uniref:J domain-containing protein n=1 Tax=Globodera pallida TaxID=36090 RepID=A0A183BU03_GLOPA
MDINQAYKILSNPRRRKAYDSFGFTDDQYVRWPPPPKKKQSDITQFLLPFGSVLGTLFFIFLVGYLLNHMNATDQTKRRRQQHNRAEEANGTGGVDVKAGDQERELNEDQKAPLTEKERQQKLQARIWRVMSPMIRELRAETQFGLVRLLKPGCRSVIVLVDKDSKNNLLQQFARHVYCLRNNKTFSFGFLMVPKNLAWFRSLLELTLPDEQPQEGEDAESVSTAVTDTESSEEKPKISAEGEAGARKGKVADGCGDVGKRVRDKLKEINPKHTLGTVLVICGWKLYFSICHPMHRPPSIRLRVALAELGGTEGKDEDGSDDELRGECIRTAPPKVGNEQKEHNQQKNDIRTANGLERVLNGFPMFLDRLLEGTVRRYYVPEWPDNLI